MMHPASSKQEEKVMQDTQAIARDLNAKNVVIVGSKNGNGSDPVVIYTNEFKGKAYFHIRQVWQDRQGRWLPGKGLSIDPANAKALLKGLGEAAAFI
jgi:rRNA maturation protein Rpf1